MAVKCAWLTEVQYNLSLVALWVCAAITGPDPPLPNPAQIVSILCTSPFTEPPTLALSWVNPATGQPAGMRLKLPVVATKFVTPSAPPREEFFRVWQASQ